MFRKILSPQLRLASKIRFKNHSQYRTIASALPLFEASPMFVSLLKVAGPVFFLTLQATSVKTALSIVKNESVGGLSSVPFLSLLTNSVVWSFYGK